VSLSILNYTLPGTEIAYLHKDKNPIQPQNEIKPREKKTVD
jgi:hypothetical protein